MTSYCPNGHANADDARFCSTCGIGRDDEPAHLPTRYTPQPPARLGVIRPAGLLAAAGLTVGAFLPWAKFTAPFVGTIDVSGIDGGDGWFFVALGAVIGIAAYNEAKPALLLFGIAALGLTVFELVDISEKIAEIDGEMAFGSVGSGLALCGASSVLAIAACAFPKRTLR